MLDRRASLKVALTYKGPALIHARVDRDAMVFPMVPPGASNADMIHAQEQKGETVLPEAVNMG